MTLSEILEISEIMSNNSKSAIAVEHQNNSAVDFDFDGNPPSSVRGLISPRELSINTKDKIISRNIKDQHQLSATPTAQIRHAKQGAADIQGQVLMP